VQHFLKKAASTAILGKNGRHVVPHFLYACLIFFKWAKQKSQPCCHHQCEIYHHPQFIRNAAASMCCKYALHILNVRLPHLEL